MAPTRVGLIGLSATSSWAVRAHLPYLKDNSKYVITALCNSSVESAQAAIKAHSLPSTVKAYGSPAELAQDEDVDVVVCSVRVDRHYAMLVPAIQAGKDVMCEWPLGKNLAEAEELTKMANEKGVRTAVFLQATQEPFVKHVKQMVERNAIGQVLSSTFVGSGYNGGHQETKDLDYLNDREVGGNLLTIHFGHSIEAITHVLGELRSYSSILDTKRTFVDIMEKPLHENYGGRKVGTTVRTSADQILLQGHTQRSRALISYHLRGGKHFGGPTAPGAVWRIYGDCGEVVITGPAATLQVSSPETKVWMSRNNDGEKPQEIEVPRDEWSERVPAPAQNIARLYEAFADKGAFPDWEHAVVRHRLIEEMYRREADGQQDVETKYAGDDTFKTGFVEGGMGQVGNMGEHNFPKHWSELI